MNFRDIIGNVIKTFIKPGELFKKTKENKQNWILPLAFIIFIYLFGSYLLLPSLILPEHLSKLNAVTYLGQQEKEAALAYFNSSFHKFSTLLSTAFPRIIYYPVLSFFLTLLPLLFGGKPVKYFRIFSAIVYTGIINSIGFMIDTFLKLKYQTLDIGLNLALFYKSSNIFINSLLGKINIFDFWQIILLIILISVYYDYNKRKSSFIILNSWILIKVISAYFTYLKVII